MKKAGRPPKFNQKIASEIIVRLQNGESLLQICRDEHMPARSTVLVWMDKDVDFRTRCARAREEGADIGFDEMRVIERRILAAEINAKAGGVVLSSMQWRLSKLAPKKYGNKIDVSQAVQAQVAVTDESLTFEEKVAEAKAMLEAMGIGTQIFEPDDVE